MDKVIIYVTRIKYIFNNSYILIINMYIVNLYNIKIPIYIIKYY